MIKPQWTFVESKYKYIAIDGDGRVFKYESKPHWREDLGGKHAYWVGVGEFMFEIHMQIDIDSAVALWERS